MLLVPSPFVDLALWEARRSWEHGNLLFRPVWVLLELQDQHLDLPFVLPYSVLLSWSLTVELTTVTVLYTMHSFIKVGDFPSLFEPCNCSVSVLSLAPESNPGALLFGRDQQCLDLGMVKLALLCIWCVWFLQIKLWLSRGILRFPLPSLHLRACLLAMATQNRALFRHLGAVS